MATRWSPDTCDCIVEYDDPASGVATTVARCAKHAPLTDQQILNALLTHNRRKNTALSWLNANGPAFGLIPVSEDNQGNFRLRFNPDASPGADPVLLITRGLTPTQVSDLQAAVDAQFGANRITVIAQ